MLLRAFWRVSRQLLQPARSTSTTYRLHSSYAATPSFPLDYTVTTPKEAANGDDDDDENEELDTYTATVALVGAPNAGKSSLSNAIVEHRVSAVSRKVNTTRERTNAVYTQGNRQLILCDTPGLVERAFLKTLGSERRVMSTDAWGAALDAEVAMFVVDASRGQGYWRHYAQVAGQLADFRHSAWNAGLLSKQDDSESESQKDSETKIPNCLLVLNKADCTRPRVRLLAAAQFFKEHIPNFATTFHSHVFVTSAYKRTGVEEIRSFLLSLTTPGEFEASPGTAHLDDDLALIRQHLWEKLLHRVHKEVPYRCYFENDGFHVAPNGDLFVSEIIRAPSRTTCLMIVGPGGDVLRWIKNSATESVSRVLGRRVVIKLRVATGKT